MSQLAVPFYISGGTLAPDAPSYITRKADAQLLAALQRGEFCYLLDTRQVGKSSLMARTALRLREQGVRVVTLDLTALGANLSEEKWYYGLLQRVGDRLGLLRELRAFWQENAELGLLQRWMEALRQIALPAAASPLVLFVDEIDYVRNLPFDTDELFAGIRECYTRRAEDTGIRNLTFCLLGSSTPNDLIRNPHITPFNIGKPIVLTDFTPEEAAPLASGLQTSERDGKTLVEQVLYWTNGHPYLTQRLCQAVAECPQARGVDDIDRLCEHLFFAKGVQDTDDHNLTFVRDTLLKNELERDGLFGLYLEIQSDKKPVRDNPANPYASALKLAGVVHAEEGYLRVRNRIYGQLFDSFWTKANMPGEELRRQAAALRRARIQVAVVAAFLLAVMGTLAGTAVYYAIRANLDAKATKLAQKQAVTNAKIAQQNAKDADLNAEKYRKQKLLAEQKKEEAITAKVRTSMALQDAFNANVRLSVSEKRAKRAAQEAVQKEKASIHNLYIARMNLIATLWEQNNTNRVKNLLHTTSDYPGRGFEWGYWNYITNLQNRAFSPGTQKVRPALYSVDVLQKRRRAVTGSYDGTAIVWDIDTRKPLLTLRGHGNTVSSVAFSPDGKLIATGSWDKTVILWNGETGSRLHTFSEHTGPVWAVAFSKDGTRLGSGSEDKTAIVRDMVTRKPLLTLRGHGNTVSSVAFSPDGKLIATGSWDSSGRLWDARTGHFIRTLTGHKSDVLAITFSHRGDLIATASLDGTARLYHADTGVPLANKSTEKPVVLYGHRSSVWSVVFTPDDSRIVTGSDDSTARVWEPLTGTFIHALRGHRNSVRSVACLQDSIVTASIDGTSQVWSQAKIMVLRGHREPVRSVVFSPNNLQIATGSQDKTVQIWETMTGNPLCTLFLPDKGMSSHPEQGISSIAYSPDGRLLVAGCLDGTAILWDVGTRQQKGIFSKHRKAVWSVSFSPDGKSLITASEDRTAIIWDVARQCPIRYLRGEKGHKDGLRAASYSPNGQFVVTASLDKTAIVWDARSGIPLHHFEHGNKVRTAIFSPDNKWVATGCGDTSETDHNEACLWSLASGKKVQTFAGLKNAVSCVAFSPDSRRLFTGGWDGRAKVWDIETEAELLTLNGHSDSIYSLAVSRDGCILVTGGKDATALIHISQMK